MNIIFRIFCFFSINNNLQNYYTNIVRSLKVSVRVLICHLVYFNNVNEFTPRSLLIRHFGLVSAMRRCSALSLSTKSVDLSDFQAYVM